MTRIRRVVATFGWWQWLLTGVLVAALVLGGMFTFRTVRFALYWGQHRDDPIERWMPIDYVARSYGVPPDRLRSALGLPLPSTGVRPDRRPLGKIAETSGRSFEELRAILEVAIAQEREARSRGEPPPPPPPGNGRPAP